MCIRDRVNASKVGSIGWCFGGGMSLQTALNVPELNAAVIYYGQPEKDVEQLKNIKAHILGIFANQDDWITPELVNAFEANLTTAGVQKQMYRYDAVHAFANPSNAKYDSAMAGDAWDKTRAFLFKHLKQ